MGLFRVSVRVRVLVIKLPFLKKKEKKTATTTTAKDITRKSLKRTNAGCRLALTR